MTSANLTRDETAARSSTIRLDTVEVDLDVRDAQDPATQTFPTAATLTFAAAADATWLDFLGESVDSVTVNGVARDVHWDGARVRIDGLAAHNVVTVRGHGRYSTSGEGLHRFRDPVDGEVYLYTQYEPADARRVYPVFEQPDMKARWRFTVNAPSGWQILSNGAETAREDVAGGVRVAFAETLPLSSYITAVAAGPYHRVDGEWRSDDRAVPLGVLCRASLAPHLDADEILDITRRGLEFFEHAFAYPYPWGKYDQIFVPEYNLGAMENPGLVTFTESYVFRGASTAAQHEGRANTILHEMAHMWFGDLVTMRWWDDLWLKESFADFMGAHAAVAAGGFPDAWVTFASGRKGWAYVQDQLPTTHPIVADITDLEAAKLNFDGITYAKGASVLKQLVAFVGEDAFFRGAQRYFADHAFGNTTLPDLLSALEAESGRDLTTWSRAWLQTSGVSEIAIERGDAGAMVLTQTDPRPHRLTCGFFTVSDGRLVRRATLQVDAGEPRTPLEGATAAGIDLVLANVDDRTYAKVSLDAQSTDAVAAHLSSIEDPVVRAVIWAALWNSTRDGNLPVARFVEIAGDHATRETNIALTTDAITHAAVAIGRYAAPDARTPLAGAWLDTCWAALWAADPGSDAQLAWARALGGAAARSANRAGEIRSMLAGTAAAPAGLALDPDLRWAWLVALAATGHASAEDADAELASDPSAQGHIAHRTVLAARPDAAVREAAWYAAWDDESLTNDHLAATIAGVRAGDRRDLIADFDDEYFARIRPTWADRSIEIARRLVVGLFPAAESLDQVDAWLTQHQDAPAALRRLVIEQRDGLARDLRVRAAQPAAR
ncbi:aminopeptidase N [Microbacterium trichothecenolyticum]|uniref:aminopeptidase N n=1 Tax=Microbacterium trichothecenolyticum TaxID=69370 RepID=UPI0028597DD6|nr:aminopeptidase N [Microbacterium trichothecenolyticum]MDR7186108.1 aminopeptidase N [Microbacterium trichothecenolyticum]